MVFVTGVGQSRFGRHGEEGINALVWHALDALIADLSEPLGPTALPEAIYVGNVFGEPGIAVRALDGLGLLGIPIVTIESACASGTVAFHEAHRAIAEGRFARVLVLGAELMSTLFDGPILPQQTDAEGRTGLAMPAMYALAAHRWLAEGRVTEEQLAHVSIKNHRHALHNPDAHRRGEFSVEQILESRLIADPLTVLQCSPISDGAAAIMLSGERRSTRDVAILGSAQRSGGTWDHLSPDVWGFSLVRQTSLETYESAGLGPGDIDVAEVHDAFTIGELTTSEALMLAPEGAAGRFAHEGVTALGGSLPINPSGGLLARGHPLGATGVAQILEIVRQLRGEAGARQVADARIGIVETMGGGVAGVDGNSCVVALFESPNRKGRNA